MVLGTFAGITAIASHGSAATPSTASKSTAPTSATHLTFPSTATGQPSSAAAQLSAGPHATLSALPARPSAPLVSTGAPTASRFASTIGTLRTDGVPLRDAFLPNLNANPNPTLSKYGTVTPGYSTGGPAPIGVAEYGIFNESGTLVPVTLNTTGLVGTFIGQNPICGELGNCTPSVLSMDTGAPDAYGLQLNAVLQNVTLFNTPGYEFWTQNVFEYSTFAQQLYIITNIWNFSSSGAGFTPNSLAGHGENGTIVPGELYYSVSGPYNISANYTAAVLMNSVLVGNDDAVVFQFQVSNNTLFYNAVNDFAIFNSTGLAGPGADAPAMYVASGSVYTPLGIPSDWEFVMGGPGGGSNVDIFSMYSQMDLYWLNPFTDQYAVVPSAYDVGSETGETTTGATALWQDGWSDFLPGPGEWIVPGPTFVSGLWNVTNTTAGFGVLAYDLEPSNGFNFFGQTFDEFDYELFAWAPPNWIYFLPPAEYTVWSMASNYEPSVNGFDVTNGSEQTFYENLDYDPFTGVYTPLWAFNETGLEAITWDGFTLYNNEYGQLGLDEDNDLYFPWFGEFNDYTFPVFAGILLWNVYEPQIISPPTLLVDYPSWYAGYLDYYGLPTSNNLGILVYDSAGVTLDGASGITGWWFTSAAFGPTAPQDNVVFWNVSYSVITNNRFETGSSALYLYGGTDNEIFNNTFVQYLPYAPNELAISGYYFGTYALFDADYGDYAFGGVFCDCWDLIFNNIFDTYFTAISPLLDPYTGNYPLVPFSEAWNVPRENDVTNIIGGDYLGGNYWWNYGTSQNPYGDLPYVDFAIDYLFIWDLDPYGIYFGGDYVPLTLSPLYVVTFDEIGLPGGTTWSPVVEASDGGTIYNYTDLAYANESWTEGEYNLTAYALTNGYVYTGSELLFVFGNETVDLVFSALFTVSIEESGLPASTGWEGVLEGGPYYDFNASNDSWLNFSVPAGTYFYEVEANGEYASLEQSGVVNVTGNVTFSVTFVALYSVTFDESGLPIGHAWSLLFSSDAPEGGNGSQTLDNASNLLGYGLSGYTYSWWVVAPGYVATPASGSFFLDANETVTIVFAAVASVTFDASGLGAGTAWTVVLTQGSDVQTQTSIGTSMTFAGTVGAYSYTVSATDYVPGVPSGSGSLPHTGPITVDFSPAATTIHFDETGLPDGMTWTVELTQGATTTPGSSVGASIAIDAVDGAYTYTVSAGNYTAGPASGSGTLPSDASVTIAFTPTPSSIAFTETGLPAGTNWTVEFTQNGTTTGYSGSTGTITIEAVQGAYDWSVNAENYAATTAIGTGTLPTDPTVSVTFVVIDGTVSGTVLPTSGTLTIGTHSVTVQADGSYSITLAPGTYPVVLTAPGYYTYYTNTTVIDAKTTTLDLGLHAVPAPAAKPLLGISGTSGWLVIGILAALVLLLLAAALVLMGRARRPPASPPPKGWSEGTTAPAGAGGAAESPEWSEGGSAAPPPGVK
ncbi:MAG: thermopsin family protease [Thermoplasmata archaeon]